MMKTGRHKRIQTSLFGIKDHRQGNGNRMFFAIVTDDINDMKIMIIQYMPENDFLGIKAVFFRLYEHYLPGQMPA